ncbi:hypothetical protein AA0313_1824 [Acetobacter indonesiensis NRIC 0313]|uniref:DUF4422 domain-containing protein n=2 Tax=Acetobacter indonesiensis TaxID=104101 RepID=A0A6N3T524_9PROT|nr:DUF4422 domain-containing protein [Acetobacter indonesiensis]GAN64402.1 hypothetical protein Abin_064_022 [Acetobacter indonesiensis]GBQ58536.1 hypothetical protein AA0313_1824 [Acetobacter indonesiensis NRIC 0313]GEN04292.1 hypothetical protein AIN02nite_23170 [Acetobacter indonesiensis]
MDIKVYVCHHKPWALIKNDVFEPIQVGRDIANNVLPGMIGDNTGDNISYKNKEWCELTALYWIWKNTSHDYVGLMHYRRYVSFNPDIHYDQNINGIEFEDIEKNAWTYEGCETLLSDYPILTSPIYNIHPCGIPKEIQSSYDHYCSEHYKKDLDLMLLVIKEKFPNYYIDALRSIYSTECFFGNIAIMRRDFFDKYCEFLFSVLEEVEKKVDISNYDTYQKRIFGFLAERLTNIFIETIKSKNKKIKIRHSPMVYVGDKEISFNSDFLIKKIIKKRTDKKNILFDGCINIVMSFDDKYKQHAQATINSILAHTQNNKNIHFYIIHDDRLSVENIYNLKKEYSQKTKISFLLVKNTFIDKFPLNREYISINTYYRLIMQEVLPSSVSRVIYLDSDIIVCEDITNLWNIDLQGKIIGGCQDEGGILQSRRLFGNKSNNSYVNAGILIFDIKLATEKYSNLSFYYSEVFYGNRKHITLQDQDIINISYKNDIKIIPLNWNVNSRIYSVNDLDRAYSASLEKEARENPFIVHFTDKKKPWKFSSTHPLKKLYWFYRPQTKMGMGLFYDLLAKNNQNAKISVTDKVLSVHYGRRNIKIPEKLVIYLLKIIRK